MAACGDDLDIEEHVEFLDEGPTTGRLFASEDLASTTASLLDDNFIDEEEGGAFQVEDLNSPSTMAAKSPSTQDEECTWEEVVETFSLDDGFDYEHIPRKPKPDLGMLAANYSVRKAMGLPPVLDLAATQQDD